MIRMLSMLLLVASPCVAQTLYLEVLVKSGKDTVGMIRQQARDKAEADQLFRKYTNVYAVAKATYSARLHVCYDTGSPKGDRSCELVEIYPAKLDPYAMDPESAVVATGKVAIVVEDKCQWWRKDRLDIRFVLPTATVAATTDKIIAEEFIGKQVKTNLSTGASAEVSP